MLYIIIAVVAVILIAIGGLSVYAKKQMEKVTELSFDDMLKFDLSDREDAVITVGIIKDGKTTVTVYGKGGEVLPNALHTYEIGSLTKTFTAALIQKAVSEGKIKLSATIDEYLDLPKSNTYPTIAMLLTHTSGFKPHYMEAPMTANFLKNRNSFYLVGKDITLERLAKISVDGEPHPFNYSNFGYATLGLVLEAVYGQDYTTLVNDFAKNDMGLQNTYVSDNKGDLGKYWDWDENDVYIPAGAITSNIDDMLVYADLQLHDERFAPCHTPITEITNQVEGNIKMGIRTDAIGMAWITNSETGDVWHNGGTSDYNSHLEFNKEKDTAVVILSNLPPNYRIPATLLGVKLMEQLSK